MRRYLVEISEGARADILEAKRWYNRQRDGLGEEFSNSIKEKVKTIKRQPHFAVKYRDVRTLSIVRFPYLIHFRINEDASTIEILGVVSMHRGPEKSIQ